MFLFKFLFQLLLIKLSICAKILAVAPNAVYSHQITFRPLWKELSLRGHQVTVLTTDPINDPSLTNLTEINLHFLYDFMNKCNVHELVVEQNRNILLDAETFSTHVLDMFESGLNSTRVQELIYDQNAHFDLVINEINIMTMLPFSWRFSCPWIGITSMDAMPMFHRLSGNGANLVLNPTYNFPVNDPDNFSFTDRLRLIVAQWYFRYLLNYKITPNEFEMYKKYFGDDLPPLGDFLRNMSMLFVNTNDIFYNKRSLNRNTVTFGDGIHIQPSKPLPKDLKQYLDEATEGVVYFSFGTNIKYNSMKAELEGYIEAFRDLPYKILWKIDEEHIANLSSNVKTQKWVPQQDILRHPNVKGFIMQAGLQSLQEALVSRVPVIAVPFYGDQLYNSAKVAKNGYGIRLDRDKVTKKTLKEAVVEIMTNSKYRENAKKLSELLKDEPFSGLEKLVWWTEYVIRHKGAYHLKSHVNDVPFYQVHLLDAYAFLFIVFFIAFYIILKLIIFVLSLLRLLSIKNKKKLL